MIIEPGVSQVVSPLLEPDQHGEMYPRYDLKYVRWQVGECPWLFSETCYIAADSKPRAAALIWRNKNSSEFWRMALWSLKDADKERELLLASVIRRIYEHNGFLISAVVSRLDSTTIGLLRRRQFLASPRRRPLHIIDSKKSGKALPELWPLSFLDTDFAYRF